VGLAGEPTIFNAETRSIFDDFFVELVRMTPFEASFRITGIMVVGMVIFWIVYCIESNGFQTTDKSGQIRPSTRWEIFLYCLSVSSTLGSSPAEPIGSLSLLTANFHAVLVQMWVVFVTGVFFTRITRTKPHIKVAQKAVIGVFNDRPALMIRFAFNSSKEELVDVRYYMTYSRNTIGSSGKSFYKFDRLDLMLSEQPRCRIGRTLVHFMDQDSPLKGKTLEDLRRSHAVVEIAVFGSERHSLQPAIVFNMFSSNDGDIIEGYNYANMTVIRGKTRLLDLQKIDCVEPVEFPDDSKELDTSTQ